MTELCRLCGRPGPGGRGHEPRNEGDTVHAFEPAGPAMPEGTRKVVHGAAATFARRWIGPEDVSEHAEKDAVMELELLLVNSYVLGASEHMYTDDPDLDGTDGAHPAWWRGQDHAAEQIIKQFQRTINGDDNGHGAIGSAGLERIRRWILEHR